MKEFIDNIFINIKHAFRNTEFMVYSIVDIVLTILLVYAICIFLKHNGAGRLIKFIAAIVVVAIVVASDHVKMPVIGKICANIGIIVAVILSVVFSQDIKRVLWKLTNPKANDTSFSAKYECSEEELRTAIDDIVRATQNMSKRDCGALIVIAPENVPEHILDSGTRLNSYLSCQLIECLFNTKAPLHDGAVYVRGNKILAAGCFLPLTQQEDLDKELGTRHRAAIGITEQSDHVAIIVSEETGIISVARNGKILRYFDSQMLTDVLEQTYGIKAMETKPRRIRKRTEW